MNTYFVVINRKTGIIQFTSDTEVEAMQMITKHVAYLEANGRRDPGWMIEAR